MAMYWSVDKNVARGSHEPDSACISPAAVF